jgi:hypothetical protein
MTADVIYLSFAVACIAFTVTETRLFHPIRQWMGIQSALLGRLISCGYCFGHWLAFLFTFIYKPKLFFFWSPLDYFVTAMVIAWISGLQWVLMCWFMKETGK